MLRSQSIHDRTLHRRRSIRLRGYDYTKPGAYYVTMVAHQRHCRFGVVVDDQVVLNAAGRMVEAHWLDLPRRFPGVVLDEYVVMPNHLHGIIVIERDEGFAQVEAYGGIGPARRVGRATRPAPADWEDGAGTRPAPTVALGDVVGGFKSITTHDYIRGVRADGWPPFKKRLWHRNYHEHIIRDQDDLDRVRSYIRENPARWALDDENPER